MKYTVDIKGELFKVRLLPNGQLDFNYLIHFGPGGRSVVESRLLKDLLFTDFLSEIYNQVRKQVGKQNEEGCRED